MLEDWEFDYIAANGDYLDIQNFIKGRKSKISDMTRSQVLDMVRYI